MNIVKFSKNIALTLYAFLLSLTICIAMMLLIQYRYYKQETQELEQVKEAYYQHVEMLKRSLSASLSDALEEPDSEEDKKKNELDQELVQTVIKQSVEFEFINSEEEQLLREIKRRSQSSKVKTVQRKKIIKKITPSKIIAKSVRYAPHRDFVFEWPISLSKFWLSSLYGPRRLSNGKVSFHHAVDMAALRGTPVKASASGRVILAQYISGYGNCVVIVHSSRYKTRYAHLDSIEVSVGKTVDVGECIGTVGDTGYVRKSGRDASHLHFEIYQDGQRVNPLKFLF